MLIVALLICVLPITNALICRLIAPAAVAKGIWTGKDIILNCTVLRDGPADRISWKKDGHALNNATLVSSLEQDGVSLLMWEGLKLDNVTDKDDGQYSCTATKGEKTKEDWYRLHIYAKPKITSPRESDVELSYGDSFIATCTADGWPKPKIWWRKKGSDEELKYAYTTKFGVVLHIKFADEDHRGMYSCYANNSIGSDMRPVAIQVKEIAPDRVVRVTTPYDHVTAYNGQTLTLRCKAFDVIEKYTAIYWEHNGARLHFDTYQHRFHHPNQVDFWYTLNNVTPEDAGNYTCAVLTHEGRDTRVIRVYIKNNGPPLVSPKTQYAYTKLGWPVTLSCTFRSVDITTSTLQWLKYDNMTIDSSAKRYKEETRMTHEGTVEYSLLIHNVTVRDLGCYGCHVNTSYGRNCSLVCLILSHSSKDFFNKILSYAPSSNTMSPFWQTTIPIFLVCLVVCMVGFIAGLLVRRNKSKSAGYWVSGDLNDQNGYQYDVFITFSSKDFHWVKSELIPLIEKHNLNYCIHNRDFEPGKTIVDNMADSVYNSRHILAVLSKNYMSSTFCRGELDMALGRNTQRKDSSLIAIRVDEIEKKRLPKALRGQMFLDFYEKGEKDAWELRLTKQLVRKDSEDDMKGN